MELAFEIEDAMYEAKTLNSLLQAVTDAAYHGSYDFADYEPAFNYIGISAYKLSEQLEQMRDEAFVLSDEKKQEKAQVLHMQAENLKKARN